jgi:hypothetical protein
VGADAELEEDLAQVVLDRAWLMKSWAPISGFRRRETAAFGLRVTADLVFASDELRRWLVVERENDLLTLDAFSVSRGR